MHGGGRGRKQLHHYLSSVQHLQRLLQLMGGKMIKTTKPSICQPLFLEDQKLGRPLCLLLHSPGRRHNLGTRVFSYLLMWSVCHCVWYRDCSAEPGVQRSSSMMSCSWRASSSPRESGTLPPSRHLGTAALPAANDKPSAFLSFKCYLHEQLKTPGHQIIFIFNHSLHLLSFCQYLYIDPTAFLKALQNKPHSKDWVLKFLVNEIPFIGGIWPFVLSARAGTEFWQQQLMDDWGLPSLQGDQ